MTNDAKPKQPAELKRIFDAHPSPVVVADATQKGAPLVYVNRAFEALTGFGPAEAVGRNCRFMQRGDLDQPGLPLLRAAIREQTATNVVLRNYKADGEMFVNKLTLTPYRAEDGEVTHFIGTPMDMTREKRMEEELLAARAVDPLTGALNRQHFWQNAAVAVFRARSQDVPLSVIKFDLDHFHTINDAYGFAAGDQVLRQVTELMRAELKPRDLLARIGSDEFAALIPGAQLGVARGVAKAIRKKVERMSVLIGDAAIKVTVSAGVSECIYEVESLDYALYRADQAMIEAQERGFNRVASF